MAKSAVQGFCFPWIAESVQGRWTLPALRFDDLQVSRGVRPLVTKYGSDRAHW